MAFVAKSINIIQTHYENNKPGYNKNGYYKY